MRACAHNARMMTEQQIRQLAHAALQLWSACAINGSDDDAAREFQRVVSQVVATTASE